MDDRPHANPGDAAQDDVFSDAYQALRRLAESKLRTTPNEHTLQATDLIHEVYVKLAAQPAWRDAEHFLAAAATAIRWILVDRARTRMTTKRGGGRRAAQLTDVGVSDRRDRELLDLHGALEQLERHDTRLAQLVQLRYFAGATIEETARVLGVSPATVKRDWLVAKARLLRTLDPEAEEDRRDA